MAKHTYFFDSGLPNEGSKEFYVAGRAHNGGIDQIEPGIVNVGQDCILYKPELGLFGVFDGAGGATDVGDPKVASLTAAKAVAEYVNVYRDFDPQSLLYALHYARLTVQQEQSAGLTTAILARVSEAEGHTTLHLAQCGDCMAGVIPELTHNSLYMDWITPEQSDAWGDPTNVLGRIPERITLSDDDEVSVVDVDHTRERHLMLASDGVVGNYRIDDGIDEADIEVAFSRHHSLGRIAHLLVDPPLERMTPRKKDDKSLVLIRIAKD